VPEHKLSVGRFLKDGATYALSTVLARSIGLLLLPILTRYISPADYGMIELAAATFALLNLVLPLEVVQGMARLQADEQDDRAKSAYASTAFWFTGGVFAVLTLIAWTATEPLAAAVFGAPGGEKVLRVAVCAMTLNALLYVVQNQLRWNLQSRAFAITNLALVVVTSATSIALIVGLGAGVTGYFLATVVGNAVALALALLMLSTKTPIVIELDRARLGRMLSFSAPLVFSGVAVYLTTYADRWLVRYWLGLEGLGLYGVAFRVASVVGIAVSSLQMAVTPLIYRGYRNPETPALMRELLSYVLMVTLPAVCLLSALSEPLIRVLTGSRFQGAAPAVGWLSLGLVLGSLYVFAPGMGLAKQTTRIAMINITAGICNLALCLTLIPLLGIRGAAIAYMTGAATMAGLYLMGSQRFYAIPYPTRAFGMALFATVAVLSTFTAFAIYWPWRIALSLVIGGIIGGLLLHVTRSGGTSYARASEGRR
jgi:O-antigen/teichoic acid export membrane protein